jgi:hypothetical protein
MLLHTVCVACISSTELPLVSIIHRAILFGLPLQNLFIHAVFTKTVLNEKQCSNSRVSNLVPNHFIHIPVCPSNPIKHFRTMRGSAPKKSHPAFTRFLRSHIFAAVPVLASSTVCMHRNTLTWNPVTSWLGDCNKLRHSLLHAPVANELTTTSKPLAPKQHRVHELEMKM